MTISRRPVSKIRDISAEAVNRREKARVQGRFGQQSRQEPEVSELTVDKLDTRNQGRKLRVGMDLDGVNYIFHAGLRRYLKSIGYDHPMPEPNHWAFFQDYGWGPMSPGEFVNHCTEGVRAGVIFQSDDWYPGVVEAFTMIQKAGHTIHVITDRAFKDPDAAEAATFKGLANAGLTFDSIHFTADKTSVPVDVMIEDKAENFMALTAAGVDTWLVSRDWNRHVRTGKRVRDVLRFAQIVAEVNKE